MPTDLKQIMFISASGMKAQGTRLRVIAENVANADSTANTPGGDPYRRKIVSFSNELNRVLGARTVRVENIVGDTSDFGLRFDPNHPAANEDGYVSLPNINTLVEVMDMREAQRSYEANLSVIEVTKSMLQRTLDILR